jgi:predicted esterase YcpF (UPF0227 family)
MRNDVKILYIYGWGGGDHSKGLIAVRNEFKELVHTIYYNQIDPSENYELMKAWFEQHRLSKIILIGNSLGGYWANWMAENFDIPDCILINPCISPMYSIGKYGVPDIDLLNYKPTTYHNKRKWIFLSGLDMVIDPMVSCKVFDDCQGTIWLDEEHAIQDYDFLVDKISSILQDD